ncbi:MAG: hypothetical protein DDT42_01724 [candidate division WS2 bacterium]|uniref:Killer suppression protein HigA n=1 Tax=Psychracetigena formicireducens TaxID=2986056 RepID=A0A9E2BHX3_PSYF1|nr:hypothetical protein [Candidatus Psychracetigena formicireducens]
MLILYKSNKLAKEFNNEDLLVKRFGERRANIIKIRLTQINAADSLDDLRYLRQMRCHELKGKRRGQLSVDLDHPYRLVFEPADNPIPKKADGGLDWRKVTIIRIISVEDTHE